MPSGISIDWSCTNSRQSTKGTETVCHFLQ